MFKVSVTKNNSFVQTSFFLTDSEASKWIEELSTSKAWGKPERWVEENFLTSEEIATAIETAQIPNPFMGPNEPHILNLYKMPAEYSALKEDVTLQFTAKARAERGLKNQNFGASVMAQIYSLNEEKFEAGTLNTAQFQTMLQNTTLATIERLLWNGSIKTAKALIESLDTTFFSLQEKNFILSLINEYLGE